MKTVFEIEEKRGQLVHDMRAILDKAEEESRDLSAEEEGQYQRMEAEVEDLEDERQKMLAAANRRAKLDDMESRSKDRRNETQRPPLRVPEGTQSRKSWLPEIAGAMAQRDSRRESMRQLGEEVKQDKAAMQRHADFVRYLQSGQVSPGLQEYSALQMDSDSAGGSMVASEVFLNEFIRGLDERVFMRQISTVLPMVMAHSVGIAAEGNDPADADWTSELLTGTLDTTMTTGKRMLRPRPVAKRILVSKTLLRQAAMAESFVRDRMLFKLSVTEEKGFLTGNGAGQPLGVFTASADGIPTTQDVSTDNTTTAMTADGLINAKYNLAEQYLRSANLAWIFHRTAVRNIRKLKDGNGQYLWNPGLGGQPNTLLDTPVFMSEYAPSTFTTGLYVGIIGDFSYYYIADSLNMTIQRLVELHAATNQDGFYTRAEVDGMPVLSEAFTRVTLA